MELIKVGFSWVLDIDQKENLAQEIEEHGCHQPLGS